MKNGPTHIHDQIEPLDQAHVRGKFVSRFGFLLAAVGSAVGLGNIWKFPYMAGQNGGGAFILVYLFCIALVGLPALILEFALGRQGQTSPVGCYRKIAPRQPWWLNGLLGVVTAFVILSFYSAVAGWVLRYFITGMTHGYGAYTAETSGPLFIRLIDNVSEPVFYQFIVMALTTLIIYLGVEKGIERASKYLMPFLFFLLLLVVIRSLTLDGAMAGVRFLLHVDFSRLSGKSVLEALGHACFTLSVGMGAMITYASYVGRDVHLGKAGVQVALFDTLIAITAGFAIFPAVFAFGMSPDGGPSLIFVTLPQVFAKMPMGRVVGIIFFFLVFIAALTSAISILEPIVTWMVDDLNFRRHTAATLAGAAVFLVGIPACLSADAGGKLGEWMIPFLGGPVRFFDLLDYLSSKFMLPIGSLILCLFLLFTWDSRAARIEVAGDGGNPDSPWARLWRWCAVSITPIGILVVLIYGIYGLLRAG